MRNWDPIELRLLLFTSIFPILAVGLVIAIVADVLTPGC